MKNLIENKKGKVLRFDRDHSFFVKRGDAKRMLNDPANALSMYNEALDRNPYDFDTRIAAAEILTNITHFEDSNNIIIPYMHLNEDFKKDAYCIAGFNFIGLGEYGAANDCFDRFFELTDEASERTDAIIDAMEYIEAFENEEPSLSDVGKIQLKSDAENARQLFEKGDYANAIKLYETIIDKKPDSLRIRYDLALAYFCNHDIDRGIEHLDKILAVDSDNIQALCLKLVTKKARRKNDEVEEISERLKNCNTTEPDDLLRLNGALLEAGKFDTAFMYARRLYQMIPYDCLASHRLALCYMADNQYRPAAQLYDRLLRINRNNYIAKYYRAQCQKAEGTGVDYFSGRTLMLQYQLPVPEIVERVQHILKMRLRPRKELLELWANDESFASSMEWALSLQEFSTCYTVLAMMSEISDKRVERCLREMIISPQLNNSLLNAALGILKRMDAPEPYYTLVDGRFLEGRVSIVDMSNVHIPKSYRNIYLRYREKAEGVNDSEVQAVAAQLFELLIANNKDGFAPINERQSIAMSAALEYLACRKCGISVEADLFERYDVTERRFLNALDKFISMTAITAGTQKPDVEGRGRE